MGGAERGRELKRIADLALFAKVVQAGGITRCAAVLGVERTTVSRRLRDLEKEFGVKLIDRTPKRVAVTVAGKRCFEQCEILLEAARNAQQAATVGRTVLDPAPLAVGAPPDILDTYLDARLREFEDLHPNIAIDRYPSTDVTATIFDVVDLAISWENLVAPNTLAQRVTGVRQSLYASPKYLETHEEPRSSYDLDDHTCIVDMPCAAAKTTWDFRSGSETNKKSIDVRFAVPDLLQARETALAGFGISRLPDYLCESFVESGRLVRVLSEHQLTDRDLYIVTPKPESSKPRATSLRLFLEDTFATHTL